jgi:type I restriction enzyme M protein
MTMAKGKSKGEKTNTDQQVLLSAVQEVLDGMITQIRKEGFNLVERLGEATQGEAVALAYALYQGEETSRVLLLSLAPERWEKATAEYVQSRSFEVMPTDAAAEHYPQFARVSDGKKERIFSNLVQAPLEIDRLPPPAEMKEYHRIKADPTYRWSMKMYERLMKGFNAFHEQVYQTVKDRVSGKNDIILEVAKILFLESFRLHHQDNDEFKYNDQTLRLSEVFTWEYVKEHHAEAVLQIQAAFDHFKLHPDYVVTDDEGESHPIFDAQTHLNLRQPRNYETLLKLIQDLGPVEYNWGTSKKTQGTLADISADVLGRAFDVFLRANFESKGGLGIYLTPAPVKQAMLEIAFHDIVKERPELLIARDEDGKPLFRFCDPACGSYGFGAVALSNLERALMNVLGRETAEDIRKEKLFQELCEHSFVGADSAPMMVTLARVNMSLLGAPKAKIFYTNNSLKTSQLKPGSFDLICTNPPFGTPKFSKTQDESRSGYEKDMENILVNFRTDLKERSGRSGGYDYMPSVYGRAMGGKPDSKGVWKPVSPTSIDPAVLFIDLCLSLLKPGGLLLIVLPDGVLCNSGDRYVREYIMGRKDEETGEFHGGKAIVKAVISLPADTFKLSGTGAKTSILYLQKRKASPEAPSRLIDEPQTDVFMAVADTLGYLVKNNVEDYSTGVSNDMTPIVGAYKRGE